MYFTSRLRKTKTAEEFLHRGSNPNFPVRKRILILQSNGSQGQQSIGLRPAIKRIPHHGQSSHQQMQADLMRPARQWPRFDQCSSILRRQHPKFGGRFLPGFAIHLVFAMLCRMRPQRLTTNPVRVLGHPIHDRQIAL